MTQKEEALVKFFMVLDGGMEKIDATVFYYCRTLMVSRSVKCTARAWRYI